MYVCMYVCTKEFKNIIIEFINKFDNFSEECLPDLFHVSTVDE